MKTTNSIFSFSIFIFTLMISLFTALGTAGMIRLEVAGYHNYFWILVIVFSVGVVYTYMLNDLKPLICVALLNVPMMLLMIALLFIDVENYDKSLIVVPYFFTLYVQIFAVRRIDNTKPSEQ